MRLGLALLVILAACDPGGSYHVPGAIPQGTSFLLLGLGETELVTHAHWFTVSLDISLAITNRGTTTLDVQPDADAVSDRKGPLERYDARPFRCAQQAGEVVQLAPGETCAIAMRFHVTTDKDQLRLVTLTQRGITRGGKAVPTSVIYSLDR